MEKTFIGNEDAYRQLIGYLGIQHPGPLILYGKKGLGKRMAAEEASCAILGCGKDELSHNGDFFLLDKKTEAIRVEDVLSLLDKSSLAALGSRKVYLICHAERMNASAQNKLLKLLEDRNRTNIVILLSERDLLLETIKSRCLTIPFFPLSAVCSEIARHQKQWLTAAYSKNDFFDLAHSMVQVFS